MPSLKSNPTQAISWFISFAGFYLLLKDLLIDFVIDLPILIDWKKNIYDLILIIINQLIKIVY